MDYFEFVFVTSITSDTYFNDIGCWKDTEDRAIKGLQPDVVGIYPCYERANALGYTVFAVQYGGECYTTSTAAETYNKYGHSTGCAQDGTGGNWAQEVYQIGKIDIDQ